MPHRTLERAGWLIFGLVILGLLGFLLRAGGAQTSWSIPNCQDTGERLRADIPSNMARTDIDEIEALLKQADRLRARALKTQAEAAKLTKRLMLLLDRQAKRIGGGSSKGATAGKKGRRGR